MGLLFAQICLFAVIPLLMCVWFFCLLREHGMLSPRHVGMKSGRSPVGKALLLVMAAAAVVYGGSKGGGDTPDPPSSSVTNYVSFVAGAVDCSGSMPTQTFIYGVAQALSSNRFTRAAYDFDGWATDATGAVVYADCEVVSNLSATAGAIVELFAKWSPHLSPVDPTNPPPAVVTNYVSFVPGAVDCSGSMSTQTFIYGEAQALSSNLFTRTTYDFAGWATDATGTVVYADCETVSNLSTTADAVVELYAIWKRMTNAYDVVFLSNGGNGEMPIQPFLMGEAQALSSNLFVRTGYDFVGWSTIATGAVVYADCQIVTNVTMNAGDVVSLYACWNLSPLPVLSTNINGVTWYYSVANGEASILNREGTGHVTAVRPLTVTSLKVPEVLLDGSNACPVTAIGENAFKDLTALTNVVMPSSVSDLSAGVFAGCGNIESATIPLSEPLYSIMPDSYKKIKHVAVPGVDEFLEDDAIVISECAFSNCTSLVSVELPLGVSELPTSVFEGCTSLASFEMPYTVTSIGSRAFAGCSALESITITEYVEEIGANAFTDCTKLKVVRYLGDEPSAEGGGAGNIYYHANTSLVSGYIARLRDWPSAPVMEEEEVDLTSVSSTISTDDAASDTNATSSATTTLSVYKPVNWPEGAAGRPLVAWDNTKYKFKKVTLNYNDGGKTAPKYVLYVAGRVLGDLPEAEGDGFIGWFTARYGGEEADPYTEVNFAKTFYAHWEGSSSGAGTRGPVDALSELYEDDAGFAFTAATFNGLLLNDGAVAGTIRVKTKNGKHGSYINGTNSAFTATMSVLGSKKVMLSGKVLTDGTANVENEQKGLSLELEFSQFGMSGSYTTEDGSYDIVAARDRYSAGSEDAKAVVQAALANAKRSWTIVLPTDSAQGDGEAFANGYSTLVATVGNKGKGKLKGTMADGTKVSVSTTLIVGDSCCCLPVVVPLYAGKSGGFACALWFTWSDDASESIVSVAGLSGWDASNRSGGAFTATFNEPILEAAGVSSVPAEATFQMDDFFDIAGVNADFSPDGTEIVASSVKWKLPKADGVKYSKDDGWHVKEGKDYGNPAGLKLNYTSKTGLFRGSFKVFSETESGSAKRHSATVTGAVVDGVGYGTATIKDVGSLPVNVK